MSATREKTSPFKLFVMFAFFGFAAVGVAMFAMYQAGAGEQQLGEVTMWGTIPADQFNAFLNELSYTDARAGKINYRYKHEDTFDTELIEALASGYGPDILFITSDQIMRNRDRLWITPYEQYDTRQFKDNFIESAEVLLLPEGIIGFPIAVDPLVLYWNRTLFANNQYTLPPRQWGELFKMSQKITERNESGDIEISTIALGEFTNIRNAKDIFIAMLMQAGGSVTGLNKDGEQIATLSNRSPSGTSPAQDALRFYTEFSNPSKSTYTWSKAQPFARDAFIAGDLAMYLGYASELPVILARNPNLNIDISTIPQLSGGVGQRQSTIARVYSIAIPRVAKNPQYAGVLINMLMSKQASIIMENTINLPSPRRDLLAIEPDDSLRTTFRNSAIMAQSWRDPDPEATHRIIAKMVESVVSGDQRMSQAISRAQRELEVLLDNN